MSLRPSEVPALLAVASLALSCGSPRAGGQAAGAAGEAAPVESAAAVTAAPAPRIVQGVEASRLAGSWSLKAEDPARRGPRLELAIDSASGASFRVRVAFMMQGDVGLDPTRFEPTLGEVLPDGRLHLTIKLKGRAAPSGEFYGTVAGDTIRLSTYRWGGDDQTAGGTRWFLIKQPN